MARYSYGSSGDEVKELQELLNSTGKYNLTVDGVYGSQTQAAVRDYQQKNSLTVDGVAGDQTLGHLRGNSSQETETPAPVVPSYQKDYTESDAVKQAQTDVQQQAALKPGEYQSAYNEKLETLYDKIVNREPFTYDMNADPMYQQLKDRTIQQGQMAMEDAMGQAAGLTGGYANTFAQKVGQQTYNQQLQTLADKVPELYQLAMSKHQMEGDQMAAQYAMLMDKENQDYARHQDAQNAWLAERDYVTGRYDTERGYDYSKWQDQRDFGVQQEATKYDRLITLITNTGYNPTAQELSDAGMSAAEAAAYQQIYNEQNTPSYSGGGYYYSGGGYDADAAKKQQELRDAGYNVVVDGIWGDQSKKAWAEYQAAKHGSTGMSDYMNNLIIDGVPSVECVNWDGGDWNYYFSEIRMDSGNEAAAKALENCISRGLIKEEYVDLAKKGAQGIVAGR